jgi:tRNA pseudouridine55 synthase
MNNRRPTPPSPLRAADPSDGILLVDKPSGPTSHDIVAFIRKHFHIPKVGHGGTLDPMATGLLLILLGRATRVSNEVMGMDKEYEGTMHLGVATDTQDADGTVIAESGIEGVTRERLEAEIAQRVGDMMQTPPMVSAVKQNGVPL